MVKYIWNWTMVAKLCPEYKKYLEKILPAPDKQCEEDIGNHPRDMRDTAPLRTHDLEDNEIMGGPNPNPRIHIPEEGEITPIPALRTHELNEDEIDIVNMMSGENTTTTREITRTRRRGTKIRENTLKEDDTPKEEGTYSGAKFILKPEYESPDIPENLPTPPLLALPPPKTVLDVGSEIYNGLDTIYKFYADEPEIRNPNQILIVHKYKFSHTYPFIRLIKASYRFDPLNDTMSDIRKEFRGLTYNYETGNAFIIKNMHKKKGQRYRTCLQGVLFNKQTANMVFNTNLKQFKTKFLRKMEEEVRKYIPDLYMFPTLPIPANPTNSPHPSKDGKRMIKSNSIIIKQMDKEEREFMNFLLILLQGKIKKRFQPPNIQFMHNLYISFSSENIPTTRNLSLELRIKEISKCKNSITRKMLRELRKPNAKNLPRVILKAIFDPYINLYGKLFANTPHTPRILAQIMYLERISCVDNIPIKNEIKQIQHLLSHILDSPHDSEKALSCFELFLNNMEFEEDINDILYMVSPYLKIFEKLFNKSNGEDLPKWNTWRDMYSMAKQLYIRIRPNKFEYAADITTLHDKFAEYFQRDAQVNSNYSGFEFMEFKSPDKEYTDQEGNKFKFTQMRTAAGLVEEGKTMHHCVGSYADKCAKGISIIFSMNNGERSYVTVELMGVSLPYQKGQVYTIGDNIITNNSINEIIDKWYNDCLKLHEKDTIPYSKVAKKLLEKFRLEKLLKIEEDDTIDRPKDYVENVLHRLDDLILEIQEMGKTHHKSFI